MSESPTTLAARQAAESLQKLELRLGCARIELKTQLENMARAADPVAPWENWRTCAVTGCPTRTRSSMRAKRWASWTTAWGLRSLSRAEFAALDKRAKDDNELRERWLRRLKIGYDRERATLAQEIEDGFADLPYADELASRRQVGNAA